MTALLKLSDLVGVADVAAVEAGAEHLLLLHLIKLSEQGDELLGPRLLLGLNLWGLSLFTLVMIIRHWGFCFDSNISITFNNFIDRFI